MGIRFRPQPPIPFSATELTARVRSALYRQTEKELFTLGDLAIRYEQREVTVAGRAVGYRMAEPPFRAGA